MNQTKVTQCPECKSDQIEKTADEMPVFDGDRPIGTFTAQYKCNACNYEFGEVENIQAIEKETCTHDTFTVWIVETRKKFYDRNKYTGKLEEASSRAHESDWSTITCECGDCGKMLDYDDINEAHEIKDWKPEESVWKLRFDVTRVTDEVRYAFGKTVEEARKNVAKGESHLVAEYPVHNIKPKFELRSMSLFKARNEPEPEPECPDMQACCFYCDKYQPASPEKRITRAIMGTCNEGGFTEITSPFQLLCRSDSGWCTGYKKKEIIVEIALPKIDEVLASPVYRSDVVDRLVKDYPIAYYRVEFKWHETEYKEQFLNVEITNKNDGSRADHWKFAFIKVNGVVESV